MEHVGRIQQPEGVGRSSRRDVDRRLQRPISDPFRLKVRTVPSRIANSRSPPETSCSIPPELAAIPGRRAAAAGGGRGRAHQRRRSRAPATDETCGAIQQWPCRASRRIRRPRSCRSWHSPTVLRPAIATPESGRPAARGTCVIDPAMETSASSAKILDGKAVAARIRADLAKQVAALAARGVSARPGRGPGRRGSGVADLRPQQGEGLRRGGHPDLRPSARRHHDQGRAFALVGAAQRRPAGRRHPDAASAARRRWTRARSCPPSIRARTSTAFTPRTWAAW